MSEKGREKEREKATQEKQSGRRRPGLRVIINVIVVFVVVVSAGCSISRSDLRLSVPLEHSRMSGEAERNAGVFASRPVVAGFLGSACANP